MILQSKNITGKTNLSIIKSIQFYNRYNDIKIDFTINEVLSVMLFDKIELDIFLLKLKIDKNNIRYNSFLQDLKLIKCICFEIVVDKNYNYKIIY